MAASPLDLLVPEVKPSDNLDRITRSINTLARIVNGLIRNGQMTRTAQDAWIVGGGGGPALPVASGGTGRTSLTDHAILVGSGVAAVDFVGPAAAGTVLQGAGASADPAFSSIPTLGIAGTTLGSLALAGNTSGTVTIKPQAAAGTFNFNLPITAGTTGQLLTSAAGGSSPMTWTSPSALSLTVGTTTIVSGSTGRILYDNAGVLGEMTTTGTGTVVVLQAGPTITNPTIAKLANLTTNGFVTTTAGDGTLVVDVTAYLPYYAVQTTQAGSVAGSAVFAQFHRETNYKRVLVRLESLNGTASYTFPTAFAKTPSFAPTNDVVAGIVTALSTTAVTVTGVVTSGFVELVGF